MSICVDQSCHSMASIANRYCCCLVEKLGFSLTLRPGAGSVVANVDFASFPLGILSHPFGSSCRHVVWTWSCFAVVVGTTNLSLLQSVGLQHFAIC